MKKIRMAALMSTGVAAGLLGFATVATARAAANKFVSVAPSSCASIYGSPVPELNNAGQLVVVSTTSEAIICPFQNDSALDLRSTANLPEITVHGYTPFASDGVEAFACVTRYDGAGAGYFCGSVEESPNSGVYSLVLTPSDLSYWHTANAADSLFVYTIAQGNNTSSYNSFFSFVWSTTT